MRNVCNVCKKQLRRIQACLPGIVVPKNNSYWGLHYPSYLPDKRDVFCTSYTSCLIKIALSAA